jgi:hypothetical protein
MLDKAEKKLTETKVKKKFWSLIAFFVQTSCLTLKCQTSWKKIDRDKDSSLFGPIARDKEKSA